MIEMLLDLLMLAMAPVIVLTYAEQSMHGRASQVLLGLEMFVALLHILMALILAWGPMMFTSIMELASCSICIPTALKEEERK